MAEVSRTIIPIRTTQVRFEGLSKPIVVTATQAKHLLDTPTKKHRESTKKRKRKKNMAKKSRRLNRH